MADVASLQQRLSDLKSQGKSLSTSKEYAKVYNQIKSMGGKTSGGSSSGSSNVINNAISMAQNAVKPAVDTMNAIVPTIKDRYDSLIKDLKGQQTTETNRQTVTTQNELGRRGIIGGGLAEQELTNALQPITSNYSSLMNQAGNTTQDYLNNLAMQVAGMQSNAGLTGLTTGANLYGTDKAYDYNQQKLASDNAATKAAQDFQRLLYQTIQLPTAKANIADTNSLIANRNSSNSSGTSLDEFVRSFGAANNQSPNVTYIGNGNYEVIKQ